jgi:hypothetical protein
MSRIAVERTGSLMMGMSYTIDRVRGVVFTRAWDVLTFKELRDLMTTIAADPELDASFSSLADLSRVTSIDIDPAGVASIALAPVFGATNRRAIVAPTDLAFGMARMFATYADQASQDVRVFREMALAEAWLGL